MIIRKPTADEMNCVFMMGYDTWGEGQAKSDYLTECHASPKYKKGFWHVLDNGEQIVSSLITYQNNFGLADRCYGIGSISTHPKFRKMGHASFLIRGVIQQIETAGAAAIYLFSDIDPRFYETFGFLLAPGTKCGDSHCMVREIAPAAHSVKDLPSYF